MIKPTVGRIVLFYRKHLRTGEVEGPMAAQVAYVHSDRLVNLGVLDPNGVPFNQTSVKLLQDDDQPQGDSFWCTWMDYQKEQAAKHAQ